MALRVLALTLPVLVGLVLPGLGVAAVAAWWRQASLLEAGHLLPGLLCSLGVWLSVAVLHFRQDRFRVAVADPAAWLEDVRARLLRMGYAVRLQTDRRLVVEPRFSSLLFGEGIGVVVKDGTAVVLGPRLYLRRLRRALLKGLRRGEETGSGSRFPAGTPHAARCTPQPSAPCPVAYPFRADTMAVVRAWRAALTGPCSRDGSP
jgi:hypothetical protein